jgi:hypothetical protein
MSKLRFIFDCYLTEGTKLSFMLAWGKKSEKLHLTEVKFRDYILHWAPNKPSDLCVSQLSVSRQEASVCLHDTELWTVTRNCDPHHTLVSFLQLLCVEFVALGSPRAASVAGRFHYWWLQWGRLTDCLDEKQHVSVHQQSGSLVWYALLEWNVSRVILVAQSHIVNKANIWVGHDNAKTNICQNPS